MNAEPEQSSATTKRPLVSIPFLIVVIVLAAGAYFAGPTIMTYTLYMLPQSMIEVGAAPDSGLPEEGGGDYDADAASGGERGGGGEAAGRGGGGRNWEAVFAERDANADGKLSGEEISERMQESLAETDTDQDGAVSKEEFMAGAAQRGGRGGGRGGRPAGEDESQTGEKTEAAGDSPASDAGSEESATAETPTEEDGGL